jgi:uncharacterized membrane protein
MKKIKAFLKTKGGLGAVIGTIAFILLIPISLFLGWGISNNWNWAILVGYFTNEIAITCYVIGGLIIILLIIFTLNARLKEDI